MMVTTNSSSVLENGGPSPTTSPKTAPDENEQFEDAEDEELREEKVSNNSPADSSLKKEDQSKSSAGDKKSARKVKKSTSKRASPLGLLVSAKQLPGDEQTTLAINEGASKTRSSDITCTDVLFGRGGHSNHHAGNIFFRQLVRAKQGEYLKANKREKTLVARDIVKLIRGLTPPGRFLKKDDKEEDLFVEVGDRKAREKASQALREGAPELREELRENKDSQQNDSPKPEKNQSKQDDANKAKKPLDQMASSGMVGQPPPFSPFFPSLPLVPGGQPPFVPPGGHPMGMGPQMVPTPYGPAMLPMMGNLQMNRAMMAAQQEAMLQLKKQGLGPGDMAYAAAAAAAGGWFPGQQQMNNDPALLQQAAMMAGKRQREEKSTEGKDEGKTEGKDEGKTEGKNKLQKGPKRKKSKTS